MRTLILALPLASLVFAAGCSCAFVEDCNTCVATAEAPAPAVAAAKPAKAVKSGDVLTMEQYQALLAQGKVTPLPEREPATVAAVETKAKAPAAPEAKAVAKAQPVKAAKTVREVKAVKRAPTVRTIPAMPLPEGWDYINEEDLTDGKLVPEAAQMFYTQAASESKAG